MANLPRPEKRMIAFLEQIRSNYVKEAWEDGELDAEERRGIRVIDTAILFQEEVKSRKEVAEAIEKGVETEAYLNKLASPIGMVINLDAFREAPKVVPFRTRNQAG